jgi:Mce-associated membrane protein
MVLAFATAAFAGHGWYAQRKLATARTQAVVAAGSLAMRFVSISAATVDADLAGVAADASGTFGRDLIRGGANLRAKVLGDKVQATGRLLRAGLVNGDLDAAAVLVAVDAIVRDARTPDGRSVHYRMRLDLAHESGRWLVTGLRYVS